MRILVVAVSLLTVNLIDCYSQLRPEALNGPKQRNDGVPFFSVPAEGIWSGIGSIEEKGGDTENHCVSVKGRCLKESQHPGRKCDGKVNPEFKCHHDETESKVCCIERCPVEKGFFSPPGSHQCFKLFSGPYTWTEANDACHRKGLVMAHPYDAVTLRSYMLQRFGQSLAWLGASGNGTSLEWQPTGPYIDYYSPLWFSTNDTVNPADVQPNCLVLMAYTHFWVLKPNQPYYAGGCDLGPYVNALCELVLS